MQSPVWGSLSTHCMLSCRYLRALALWTRMGSDKGRLEVHWLCIFYLLFPSLSLRGLGDDKGIIKQK